MNNDQRWMQSSYIVTFFHNVGMLTSLYSEYVTMSVEFGSRTDLSDSETQYFQKSIREIKILSTTVFVQYEAIALSVKSNDVIVKSSYESLLDSVVLRSTTLKDFVSGLNLFLVNSVISELFDKSQDFLNSIASSQSGK